jgi:hypothetical protein
MDEEAPNNSTWLLTLELGQMNMRTQLDDIIMALSTLTNNLNPHAETSTPHIAPTPPATPPPTIADPLCSHIKPAAPSKFDGNQTEGHTFYNSCMLYIKLHTSEFPNNDAKINWVVSYMKTGQAATWADRLIRYE